MVVSLAPLGEFKVGFEEFTNRTTLVTSDLRPVKLAVSSSQDMVPFLSSHNRLAVSPLVLALWGAPGFGLCYPSPPHQPTNVSWAYVPAFE